METLIGEIVVLAIVCVAGFVLLKIFGKRKGTESNSFFSNNGPLKPAADYFSVGNGKASSFYEDRGTRIVSTWNVCLLNAKTGSILKTIPISIGTEDEITIGRDSGNYIQIHDNTISGVHACIETGNNGCLVLRDNDSTNGLVIVTGDQEQRQSEIPLSEGLVVYLGDVPLGFTRTNSRKDFTFSQSDHSPSQGGEVGTHIHRRR